MRSTGRRKTYGSSRSREAVLMRAGYWSQPLPPPPPEVQRRDERGDEEAPDPVADERLHGRDVLHQPAEVLAEEARDERPDEEERRDHGEARHRQVEPVGVRVEVRAREGVEVVRLAVELAGHLGEVVADVAQVLARAA